MMALLEVGIAKECCRPHLMTSRRGKQITDATTIALKRGEMPHKISTQLSAGDVVVPMMATDFLYDINLGRGIGPP